LRQAKKKYTKKERRNIKQRGPEEIVAVAGAKVQPDHSTPRLIPKISVRCKYKA